MRIIAYAALTGLAAVFVLAAPKSLSALPAAAGLNHVQPQAGSAIVQVKKRYRRYYRRPYYRGYNYRRPYYRRPYYGRGYYRPYYYRRPYYRPYYRPYFRPGFSIWIG